MVTISRFIQLVEKFGVLMGCTHMSAQRKFVLSRRQSSIVLRVHGEVIRHRAVRPWVHTCTGSGSATPVGEYNPNPNPELYVRLKIHVGRRSVSTQNDKSEQNHGIQPDRFEYCAALPMHAHRLCSLDDLNSVLTASELSGIIARPMY